MPKVALLNICFLLFISNLFSQNEIITSDYIAVTVPEQYDGEIFFLNDDDKIEVEDIRKLRHDSSLLNSFPNLVSNVTVYKVNEEGELSFSGIGISGKNELYEVIYDFTQTQTINTTESLVTNSILVGVGVRMIAKIKTRKAGINLNSLFSLVAEKSKVEGSLEVRVNGVSSQKISSIIPTTTDLSPASISTALQAVATIKSHIYSGEN